ncbi:MAG: TolB family protein, partial [Candidatus Promineifilaceae bacterium]
DEGAPLGVEWSPGGCHLTLTQLKDNMIELFDFDLATYESKLLFQLQQTVGVNAQETFQSSWAVSPTGDHVSYIIHSGQHDYATSEFQDLEIRKVMDNSPPRRLSSRGGTLSFAWAPDGNGLAFSDYDTAGIRQLYHVMADGSHLEQITMFHERGAALGEPAGNYIGLPVWSPGGESMAFEAGVTEENGEFHASLWAIPAKGGDAVELVSPVEGRIFIMGWKDDGARIAAYMVVGPGTSEEEAQLLWLDPDTGETLMSFPGGTVPGSAIRLVGALRGDELWLGESPSGELYFFQAEVDQVVPVALSHLPAAGTLFLDIGRAQRGETSGPGQPIDWAIAPPSFEGTDRC